MISSSLRTASGSCTVRIAGLDSVSSIQKSFQAAWDSKIHLKTETSSTTLEREWCFPEESDKEWQEGCQVKSLELLRGHDKCQLGALY